MLNTNDSLLLIIDMQDKLINASFAKDKTCNNLLKILKSANILSVPVIATEQYPKGLGFTNEIIKNHLDKSNIYEKVSFSILAEEKIKKNILKEYRKQIIIAGIETHICVLQSAIDLLEKGYDVYILEDCCSSRQEYEHKTGIKLLKQYGAKIVSAEIAIFQWLKTSKHPNFKEIQAIIK